MISQCIQQMAMKILKENPNIANNPNAQSMINVIQSNVKMIREGLETGSPLYGGIIK